MALQFSLPLIEGLKLRVRVRPHPYDSRNADLFVGITS